MGKKLIRFSIIFCIIVCMLMMFSACGTKQNESLPVSEDSSHIVKTTKAQQIYEDMLSAGDHLRITDEGYKLNNYPISWDSVSIIGDQLVVNQGVIYDEIAAALSLYCEFGSSRTLDAQFFQVLTGSEQEPENWSELAQELYSFICVDGTEKEILSKLETMNGVSGSFDYKNRSYAFTVEDLEALADDLQISDEMMGYILAKLSEYQSEFIFDGVKLTATLEVQTFS